jgi:NADH-quinone oxidoreductase subunit L
MGGEQDMRKMGGLRGKMKITYWTFLIACLAIAGVPPLSGFFSKDEILGQAFGASPVYWVLGVAGAVMTAFYMFRALGMTFFGRFRGTDEQAHHVHESPAAMTIPLVILAILAFVGGWVGIPRLYGGSHPLGAFLAPVFAGSSQLAAAHESSPSTEWGLIAVTTILVILAIVWAWTKFAKYTDTGAETTGLARVLENKWYIDELYDAIIGRPLKAVAGWLSGSVEKYGVDGVVNGVGRFVGWGSRQIRLLQTGRVGFYLFGMVVGMVVLLVIAFFL